MQDVAACYSTGSMIPFFIGVPTCLNVLFHSRKNLILEPADCR
jgi:hypothetical protein